MITKACVWYHDGVADFPHGAGPSIPGWYVYSGKWPEPDGPLDSHAVALAYGQAEGWFNDVETL